MFYSTCEHQLQKYSVGYGFEMQLDSRRSLTVRSNHENDHIQPSHFLCMNMQHYKNINYIPVKKTNLHN